MCTEEIYLVGNSIIMLLAREWILLETILSEICGFKILYKHIKSCIGMLLKHKGDKAKAEK